MNVREAFKVLHIAPTDDMEVIKNARKALIKQVAPDLHMGLSPRMQELALQESAQINVAHDVLKEARKHGSLVAEAAAPAAEEDVVAPPKQDPWQNAQRTDDLPPRPTPPPPPQGPPHGGDDPPPVQQPRRPRKHVCWRAVRSLVRGIIGAVFCLGSLLAVALDPSETFNVFVAVFGALAGVRSINLGNEALTEIAHSGGCLGGRGIAMAGRWLGIISVVSAGIVIAIVVLTV